MSRFFDAVRRADGCRLRPSDLLRRRSAEEAERERRGFRVISVVSNKGGVGKTTVATNLAVYLRAMREDLPILVLGLDDQPAIDRMFAIGAAAEPPTVADALRAGSLAPAIRLGQYGVHYVPTSARISELKREIADPGLLESVLERTGWRGIVVVDTKSDLEILTQNALRASDLALVLARDQLSLGEAGKVFELLGGWKRPRETARVLLSLVDLRVRYAEGGKRDVLSLLLSEIRSLGHPLFETFLSSSPKVESLQTNPARAVKSILHGAPTSIVHRQMRLLAEEVLRSVAPAEVPTGEARPAAGARVAPARPEQPVARAPERAGDAGVGSWLGRAL